MSVNESAESGTPEQPTTDEKSNVVAKDEVVSTEATVNEHQTVEVTPSNDSNEVVDPTTIPKLPERPIENLNVEMTLTPVVSYTIKPPRNGETAAASQRRRIEDSLNTLPFDTNDLNTISESYKFVDMTKADQDKNWLLSVSEGYKHIPGNGAFIGSVNRPTSLWKQSVKSGAEEVRAGSPQFSENVNPGDRLTGERAVMHIQGLLKLGQNIRAPMWHTGIWLTFRAPTEAALLELDRRIASEKVKLGRDSKGLVFSNNSVYMNSFMINFALAHVYDSTLRYKSVDELKKFIRVTDLPLMIWGLLCTMYPSGYPHVQPCVKDPSKCSHLTEELISIGKLLWTDERSLSERQRRHMVEKQAKFNQDELTFYTEEHKYHEHSTLVLNERISIELKVPTLFEYEESGFEWVDSIVRSTDNAFGGTMRGDERENYIFQVAQISALRNYGHYVKRIVIDGSVVIDDRQTIEATLETLTSDSEIFDTFFDGIQKFIDNSTVSTIAIPKFDCPKCSGENNLDAERKNFHPYLIPLDVLTVFFTLLDPRLIKILTKSPTKT